MTLRHIPALAGAAVIALAGLTACGANSAPINTSPAFGGTSQPSAPRSGSAPTASASATAGTTPKAAAPTAVNATLCGKQVLFVPDVTISDCTWTGGTATPAGGQHFLQGNDESTFDATVRNALIKGGYQPQAENAGAQTVYVGQGWMLHVISIAGTVSIQFLPTDPNAGPDGQPTASATATAATTQDSTTTDKLPDPVPASVVKLKYVPEHWILPGEGRIDNLQDTPDGATYDLAKFTTDQLINFYRMNLSQTWFTKISDTTVSGTTMLVYDDDPDNTVYRTTITSTPSGVHVEHRKK